MDAGRSDKITDETRREAEVGEEEEEEEDDDGDDGDDEEDDEEDEDCAVVGAAAVLIHERPVVLQAPVVGRPFLKQAPHFFKTAGQQPNKLTSNQASQPQRPDETSQPGTCQSSHSARVRQTENVNIVDHKSGTLQLGECCYNLQSQYTHTYNYTCTFTV
jgi:hypothetical protein